MEELTMYNANALNVKLDSGENAYFEVQEYIDLFSLEGWDGFVAGHYYFESLESNKIVFVFTDQEYIAKTGRINSWGYVTSYSHDYGKTWVEVE